MRTSVPSLCPCLRASLFWQDAGEGNEIFVKRHTSGISDWISGKRLIVREGMTEIMLKQGSICRVPMITNSPGAR